MQGKEREREMEREELENKVGKVEEDDAGKEAVTSSVSEADCGEFRAVCLAPVAD